MKRIFYIIPFLLMGINVYRVHGGQYPQFTQYMLNNYYYNPALAGTYKQFIIKMDYRVQWIDMPGGPQTGIIAGYGPNKNFNMGYGGHILIDNTGLTSRINIMGSFAYNVPVFDEYRLSFGLSAGVKQFTFDASQMDLDQQDDPYIKNQTYVRYRPDANVGVYFHSDIMYAGFASHQLFGNKLNDFPEKSVPDDSITRDNRLMQHFYLMGGYKVWLNREWAIEPSLLLQGSYPEKPQLEISASAVFENSLWAGLSYRFGDRLSLVSILARYKLERKYEIGIAYDLNAFSKYSTLRSGSVEVLFGYWFDPIR